MSDTRLVRIICTPSRRINGQVLRVPVAIAEDWIAQGIAEYAPAPVETAMLDIGRASHKPPGKGRKVEQR